MLSIKNKSSLTGQRMVFRLLRIFLPYSLYEVLKGLRLTLKEDGPHYGQHNVDEILRKYFPEDNGRYMDIGSGNPKYLSNTYFFYTKGWTGYLIDPIQSNIFLSKLFRKRDVIMKCFIGKNEGSILFFQLEPSYFSTSDSSVAKYWISKGAQLVKSSRISVQSIRNLNFNCEPNQPVFISIDVEGNELDVLSGIDFKRQSPRAFIIETWNSDEFNKYNECKKILEENCYTLAFTNNENDIWLHQNYSPKDKKLEMELE
jgi:FkbM family methyltransferase